MERDRDEVFDIDDFLKHLTERPGVYRMLDNQGQIIYVGKAKNLKRRVSSYFKKRHDEIKTAKMVEQVARIEVTITETESEAFILENTLIKRHKPKYNILFRDDKSYPYIYVSTAKKYPSLSFHRGAKRRKGEYFGPFPNASAVHHTLHALQKIFPVRQCAESVFQHRSRPCLQYQIKRCSGPCIEGLVSDDDYQRDVRHTMMFLQGKSFAVVEELGEQMQQASMQMEYEQAAVYRDRISALRSIQSQHLINQPGNRDIDVIAVASQGDQVCLCLMMYRGGNLWGSETFFPKVAANSETEEIIDAFIVQHYQLHPAPHTILLDRKLTEEKALQSLLTEKYQRKTGFKVAKTQTDKSLWQLAQTNAEAGLKQQMTQKSNQLQRLKALQEALELAQPPKHMECFDISHTQGNLTVASCVVFKDGVPSSSDYRKFNIEGIQPGDDYAAMHQVLQRRYSRLKKEADRLPDLVVIDGGKGQLNQAIEVLKGLELDFLPLVSVAKGEGRKAGLEVLYTPYNSDGIDLADDDVALHLINHIRDEAHRFAITSHRKKRAKAMTHSRLEDIQGIGPKTRKNLLLHFGGLGEVKNAAVSELQKVKGISKDKAQTIYDFFHGEV
ncbi:excinuclease ABC subunit UvrC [Thiomicrorhabdus xiamenensis]|uniref:UvrABC system protein C n=1 Tax=Thiomicrorhabdus xiamenensis TaxID=2739063 RepID=A0A7D4NQK2_9GAMM|nr:excinuclease ABC subunit UvrC [Thiomicrorhabdus xiamenensis]QKI89251.1 excinuclease ABC subunit UvrC [Thiomicrorhabdus xiamenensis]